MSTYSEYICYIYPRPMWMLKQPRQHDFVTYDKLWYTTKMCKYEMRSRVVEGRKKRAPLDGSRRRYARRPARGLVGRRRRTGMRNRLNVVTLAQCARLWTWTTHPYVNFVHNSAIKSSSLPLQMKYINFDPDKKQVIFDPHKTTKSISTLYPTTMIVSYKHFKSSSSRSPLWTKSNLRFHHENQFNVDYPHSTQPNSDTYLEIK